MRGDIELTVNEFFAYYDDCNLIVKSGYSGRILTQNYNPTKHSKTIGIREIRKISTVIKAQNNICYSCIVCIVNGDVEYTLEMLKRRKNNE